MKNLIAVFVAPILFLSLTANGNHKPRLTLEGFGDIRIGMSVDELKNSFRATLEYDMYPEVKANACAYRIIPAHPELKLMIVDGNLARIEVHTSDYVTKSGAKIGMSEVEIASIYGSWMKIDYHPYLGKSGSYLILESANQRHKMIFETGTPNDSGDKFRSDRSDGPNPNKHVTSFRAGLAGPVSYIEGCA